MTLRTMLGLGWSIVCGLVGGWLVLMPWALDLQGSGDWTTMTKVSFFTGIGLLVFCAVGLGVTGAQIAQMLRPERAATTEAKVQQQAEQDNLDQALLQLATKLVADLETPPAAAPVAAAPVTDGISPRAAMPPSAVPPATGPGEGAPAWRRVD